MKFTMKNRSRGTDILRCPKKCLFIMRCMIFFLILGTLQSLASTSYSQSVRLSLKIENATVQEVLSNIEQESSFYFTYNSRQINANRKVSIKVKNRLITDILDDLFKGEDVNYTINDKHIVLFKEHQTGIASVQQQSNKITGVVTDPNGEPIIGANVMEKGTGSNGTITSIDGDYSLNVKEGAVLVFSYIGYNTQEIPVNGKSVINVVLTEDAQTLEEVVIVGYGQQKRASVTGSVAAIQAKEITTVKTPNVSNTLAGKLPGLRAVQRSGAPGDDDAKIDIRGYGDALVIVDGIERDFKQIDANDIESISVLKDASAAVYGFKGANGVILITTKKGQVGKPKINYSGYVGFQSITRYPEFYNAYEYATLYNEAQLNVGVNAPYTAEEIEKYRLGNDPAYPNTDWWGEITRSSVPQMYHNVNVSGGAEKVKYYFSLGYTDQEGIYKSGDFSYQKYNVRSNVSAEITKGFTVDLQLSGLLNTRNKVREPEPITRNAQMAVPILPIYANNTAPYWQNTGDKANPVQSSRADEIGYDKRDRREFNGSIAFNWEIPWVKGLSAKALLAYDYNNMNVKNWYKEYYDYSYDAAADEYKQSARHAISELEKRIESEFTPTQQYSINYKNTFGKHDISALVLWEMYNSARDSVNLKRQFYIGAIDELEAGDNVNKHSGGWERKTAHEGLVGRLNYAYDSKYLAEVSFRYDGSYKFANDQRWGFFPAVSLGWRISEESFFRNQFGFVDNLKIRGSYGKIGDEGDFLPFQYLAGYKYPDGK